MKHQRIRKEIAKRLGGLLQRDQSSLPVVPRLHQVEALQAVETWLTDPKGSPRGHIAHATGMGKTTIFSLITNACFGLRVLIVVPTKVLVEQAARVISRFTEGSIGHVASLSTIRDENNDTVSVHGHNGQDVVITTNASFKRYTAMLATEFDPQLIIYDECHWAYVEECQRALREFRESVIIGFTATPDYLGTVVRAGYVPVTLDNGQVLWGDPNKFAVTHFGPRLDHRSLRWGIENRCLAPLAWGMIEFDMDLSNVHMKNSEVGYDYDPHALQEAMTKHWSFLTRTICRLYDDNEYGLRRRQTFAVCPSVASAEQLAEAVRMRGITAGCVTGTTSTLERNTILGSFGARETKFLTSVMVLREGWDAPAEICMMLRPTKSRVAYEQYLGRTTRLNADGSPKTALMLDLYQQGGRFSPLSAPVLFGAPGKEIQVGGILMGPHDEDLYGTWDDNPLPPKPGKKVKEKPEPVSPYLPKNAKPKLVIVRPLEYIYYANKDGFFVVENEEWGTFKAIARRFGLGQGTVQRRIATCKVRTCKGRDSVGKAGIFHSLADAKKACADMLKELPKADKHGFFMDKGEEWGTGKPIARRLGLSHKTLHNRLKASNVRQCHGREAGRKRIFYSLTDAKKACADMFKDLPRADKHGFFMDKGEEWGTARAIARRFGLSNGTVQTRIATHKVRTCKGRDSKKHALIFHSLTDAKKACADMFKDLPRADKHGFFMDKGEEWGTGGAIARRFGGAVGTVLSRLRRLPYIRSRIGFVAQGQQCNFYPVSNAVTACADLLAT